MGGREQDPAALGARFLKGLQGDVVERERLGSVFRTKQRDGVTEELSHGDEAAPDERVSLSLAHVGHRPGDVLPRDGARRGEEEVTARAEGPTDRTKGGHRKGASDRERDRGRDP